MSFKNLLKKIAQFQVTYHYLVLIIIIIITAFMIYGSMKVRTVASLEQMMPKGVDEIQAFNNLRDNALGQDMIAIVIYVDRENSFHNPVFDVLDKRSMSYIQDLKKQIQSNNRIIEAYGASDVILMAANSNPARTTPITHIDELSSDEYLEIISDSRVKNQLSQFVNTDKTVSIIIASTDVSADDETMKLLSSKIIEDISDSGNPPGIKTTVTGTPIIQQKLGVLIASDRNVTQNISTLFVFIIVVLVFASITSALIPIIIVTISVYWLYGIMGYSNLPISTLAGGVAAMVIGIGIDYSIMMINKYKNLRKSGKNIEFSIIETVQETGYGLTGAAIATMLAFIAFLVGSMPEMNRFGLLMTIGVGSAFLLSIIALPSLLSIEEKLFHLFSRKMRFGIDKEFILYEKETIHPETHDIVEHNNSELLNELLKDYKIVKKRNSNITIKKGERK